MLNITIPESELWDDDKEEFIHTKSQKLTLEHSLVSLSKWESIWKKPFLSKDKKTYEETISYIKCMTITQNVDDNAYLYIPKNTIDLINNYIDDTMTATVFSDNVKGKGQASRRFVTSELIYSKMVVLNVPAEFQKWHLNRLITLITILEVENKGPQKKSSKDVAAQNKAINEARRKKYNTKG